jgi:ABC-type multidrug transport system fused ATPase/permease subunit
MQLKKFLYEVLLEHKFYIIGIFISGIIIIISTSSIPYYIGLSFQEIKDYSSVKNIHPLVFLSIYYLLRSIFKIVRNHGSLPLL